MATIARLEDRTGFFILLKSGAVVSAGCGHTHWRSRIRETAAPALSR